jgi:hypothetical protein
MKDERVADPRLEKSLPVCLNLEIEELEPVIAPGNTWSV